MTNRKYHKATDHFFSKLAQEYKTAFFKGKSINPLKILAISSAFSTLRIKDEDLLVLYSLKESMDELDFIITTQHIHIAENKIPLVKEVFQDVKFSAFPKEHISLLNDLVDDLLLTKKDEKKSLSDFTNKFKDFVNQKEDTTQEFDIDYDFLQILKNEGEKIQNLAEDLNNNKRFSNTINAIVHKSDDAIEFKAEHVILQDIIRVFNMIYPLSDAKNTVADAKVKFLLAFMFEKLQGNDIIASLSIERINKFVQSEKFDENIEVIKTASLFDLGEEYKNEFLLPSLLKRLDSQHFANSASFLYRIASLVTKADGTISEEETTLLKKINGKLQHPKEKLEGVKQTEIDENETLDDVMDELNELIGLDNIKTSVKELSNFLKVQKLREEKGLKNVNNSLHSVFMGPPGTGKTTVARLVSKIYKHLGYLEKGHLVETDRTGMVAGYVGQTALKVEEVVKTSLDGVLFIDEAYSLAKDNKKDFGNEAVEVLLKKMEDHRDQLVVIVAGYPDEMEEFIESNPGLQSRFNRYFTFDHYKPKELIGIFELFCLKNDFVLADEAKEKLEFIFDKLYEKRHKSFGNARVARNLFEKIIEYQANRIVSITPLTEELLKTIIEDDIPPVNQTVDDYLRFQKDEEEA
ncbi:ATPase family associated with various cellular activities (AAA) [Aquimarina amphilecti]|uniref:ATPase family associated with various cellular activities (AAA) n=1 Tax=Aquimarina amphilecti TaxID=1038014 RepID=A0A1H7SFG4_AQUAM|nr:AAA family ATPase [Aquimarina amphilecti]SEL70237.1 ATPase family associated with various cellular activities (AAA) [Aquimarina amphilecti]